MKGSLIIASLRQLERTMDEATFDFWVSTEALMKVEEQIEELKRESWNATGSEQVIKYQQKHRALTDKKVACQCALREDQRNMIHAKMAYLAKKLGREL